MIIWASISLDVFHLFLHLTYELNYGQHNANCCRWWVSPFGNATYNNASRTITWLVHESILCKQFISNIGGDFVNDGFIVLSVLSSKSRYVCEDISYNYVVLWNSIIFFSFISKFCLLHIYINFLYTLNALSHLGLTLQACFCWTKKIYLHIMEIPLTKNSIYSLLNGSTELQPYLQIIGISHVTSRKTTSSNFHISLSNGIHKNDAFLQCKYSGHVISRDIPLGSIIILKKFSYTVLQHSS